MSATYSLGGGRKLARVFTADAFVNAIPCGQVFARSAADILSSMLGVDKDIITHSDLHKFRRIVNLLRERGDAICSGPSGFYRPLQADEAGAMARQLAAHGWAEVQRARRLVSENVWNDIKRQLALP